MTGQDAVNAATQFHEKVGITGVILTKMDGDARGGAALSIKASVGVPIKFIGIGEKLDALDAFHPDRMASQILGMGDVLSLIEKVQDTVDEKEARKLAKKLQKAEFTLEDFLSQLKQIKKMGSLESLMSMIPGMNKLKGLKNATPDEKELKRVEAIILSMTPAERKNPKILNGSRRKRIAMGSGVSVADVNKLLKNFEQMKKMMKKMGKMGKMDPSMMSKQGMPF
jgi:signal recognition particle subunit SRP54